MRNTIKQLKKSAREVGLDTKERLIMRANILRAMKEYPAQSLATGHIYMSILSPYVLMRKMRNLKTMPLLVIAGVLVGGTVSFAAEYTIPGDVLYPVKVHVNENVRGTVAVTPKAKAQWEVELVGRRLDEVEKLAHKTGASEEAKETARKNIVEYTNRAKDRIAKFEQDEDTEDALFVATKLSETLRGHETVLDDLVFDESDDSGEDVHDDMLGGGATTTPEVATSTSVVVEKNKADKRSLKNILKEVRQARDNTESKVTELEQKRNTEKEKERKTKDDQKHRNNKEQSSRSPNEEIRNVPDQNVSHEQEVLIKENSDKKEHKDRQKEDDDDE
ncbi:MAG: hypothetical protein UY07_C0009G0013 [Parcubacteria group bacterium GW2011_GWA1_47_8]|nr:MAG: hypothetical protein UY07_C0009G0013 [Parcubacteria group bacterium GW2011_GWA1_47_8]KKW07925.1 MAG: hypothetical protein UY42_C0003G0017 [Parcubacteria group bacterium GW2011_GWA2_49_16]